MLNLYAKQTNSQAKDGQIIAIRKWAVAAIREASPRSPLGDRTRAIEQPVGIGQALTASSVG